jgi:hypothetical protein
MVSLRSLNNINDGLFVNKEINIEASERQDIS